MSLPKEQYRKLLLSDYVKSDTVKDIITSIMAINADDNEK